MAGSPPQSRYSPTIAYGSFQSKMAILNISTITKKNRTFVCTDTIVVLYYIKSKAGSVSAWLKQA